MKRHLPRLYVLICTVLALALAMKTHAGNGEFLFNPWVRVWKPDLATASSKERKQLYSDLEESKKLIWQYPDSCISVLQNIVSRSVIVGAFDIAAIATTNMGLSEWSKGNFTKSLEYYNNVKKYVVLSKSKNELLANLYVNIGSCYFYQNNYQKAFEYYYSVLNLYKDKTTKGENLILAYNNIADVLIQMEQYDKAIYYLDLAEMLIYQMNKRDILSYTYCNRAEIAFKSHQDSLTLALTKDAILLAKRYNNGEVEQAAYFIMAKFHLRKNENAAAIGYLEKSIDIKAPIYPFLSDVAPKYMLGFLYYKEGQYKESKEILQQAIRHATLLNVSADKATGLKTLADIYELEGDYKNALKIKNEYIALSERLNTMEKKTMSNELEIKYRTAEKDRKVAESRLLIVKINQQLEQTHWLFIGAIVLALLLFILSFFIFRNIRHKNKITVLRARVEGEELERKRVAEELHDGVGGMLAVAKMKLTSGIDTPQSLYDLVNLLNETASQVRSMAHNLMPDLIENYPFSEIVLQYIDNINQHQKNLHIDIQIGTLTLLDNKNNKLSAFRIIQELIQNIVKHAMADHVSIQIFEHKSRLSILIEDNGIGFSTEDVKIGLGLTNLKNRVLALQGTLQIDSIKGRGTTSHVELNLSASNK